MLCVTARGFISLLGSQKLFMSLIFCFLYGGLVFVIREDKRLPFLIASSFLASVLLIRLSVWLAGSAESEFAAAAKAGALPETQFYIGSNIILFGYHIHHFYFGFLLLCIGGWLAIVGSKRFSRTHAALLYGAGLGLFLDEIGLLLTWGDYHSSLTYIWCLVVLALFFNIIFFSEFWLRVKKNFVKSKQSSLLAKLLQKNPLLFGFLDQSASNLANTERVRHVFSAVSYLLIGAAVLVFPRFVHYWVAAGLVLWGGQLLARAFLMKEVKYEVL